MLPAKCALVVFFFPACEDVGRMRQNKQSNNIVATGDKKKSSKINIWQECAWYIGGGRERERERLGGREVGDVEVD